MEIIDPATGELIRELKEDTKAIISAKFQSASNAQREWERVTLADRVKVVNRFSDLLLSTQKECAQILTSEVGKPLVQSMNEIAGARTRIAWLAAKAEQFLADEIMHRESGLEERIAYEPLGVICNISAWNYPYLVGVNVFIPALLGGNSVLYKPSEFASMTGLHIGSLLAQAGLPEDVFHVVIGGPDAGNALLELPFDGYFFTGSYKTGKYIYERVASKMVPCQCELGGKDPLYVADDVLDIPAVASATADGAFYNNGQSCCAVERIYAHERVYEKYVSAFVDEVRQWKVGNPLNEGVYIGPLTRKNQIDVLEAQIADAVAKGARILTGGKRLQGKGFHFEPTVLVDVDHSMTVMKEESFGPLIGIMKVGSDEEAVGLMNDTDYGLTASVYSQDESRARAILSRINAGTGYWNCCDRVSAALPWSGRKNSGIGSTLSHAGLRAFVKPKAYHLKN